MDNASWEKVFVRHVNEDHRLAIDEIEPFVKAPFPTCSSSHCQGDFGGTPIHCRPSGRWLIGLDIVGQSWISMFSNAAGGDEIFKAAAKSRRLEMVLAGNDTAKRGWFFKLNRAGKRSVDFALPAKHTGHFEKAKFKSTELGASFLDECNSGEEAVDRLCRQFEVDLAACELDYTVPEFRVISVRGKPLFNDVRGYFERSGYAIFRGDNPASDALQDAIEQCDPEAIRAAVAQGARLDALPDTLTSPLKSALYKCGHPNGKECVKILVELGCPVNGGPHDDPTVIDCVAHFLDEGFSLDMLKIIVPLGADVNAVSPGSGSTALHTGVVYRRAELIHFLLDHGADPTIEDNEGVSPIDWLTKRLKQESLEEGKRREFAEILGLLTGQAIAVPVAEAREEEHQIVQDDSGPGQPLSSDHSAIVRRHIAECVGIDVSRVTPEASLFNDLGGNSEHLRPLRLRIEQSLGVSIEPVIDDINARTRTDAEGQVTYESLKQVKSYLPAWSAPLVTAPFPSLFTVSMIEAIVAKGLELKGTAEVSASPASEHVAAVRKLIAGRAKVPVDQLTPETNLIRDLELSEESLGFLFVLIGSELDSNILPVLNDLFVAFEVDEQDCLTAASQERLRRVLPDMRFEAGKPMSLDDLQTVALIESVAAKALAGRPADLPTEPIWGWKQQEWVRQLPEELGERKFRLLMAGGLRYAFQPGGKLEREVADAIELLERFADTGKSKTALKKFRGAFRDDWWQGDRWTPRAPEYHALYEALTPTNPEAAFMDVTNAICATHKLSSTEVVRELRRLHSDLVSPLADPGKFAGAWRTPSVVELAKSMYEARDFREMSHLAEALEQAGCTSQIILDHCRDPKALHMRGCWVVDAVLDGSWAKAPKVARSKRSKEKPLLSQLPKHAQYMVRKLIEDEDCHLTIEEYLAKRWDFVGFEKSRGATDKHIDDRVDYWSNMYPTWPPEQVEIAMSFDSVKNSWGGSMVIARRIAREDPAELGRGESLAGRMAWLEMKLLDVVSPGLGGDVSPWEIVSDLAVRDVELAERTAERAAQPTNEEGKDLVSRAILAVFRHDFDSLRALTDSMTQLKVSRDEQWIHACLKGVAERDPELVTQGLQNRLDYERRRRSAYRDIVTLEAHGFYRLCQWASPELVAAFDVTQPLPWDAEFHAWVEEHENPLEAVDLTGISPVLHEAVVLLDPPDWWVGAEQGSQMDMCELLLRSAGENPKAVIHNVKLCTGAAEIDARTMVEACPTVISSGLPRVRAEIIKRELEAQGASVEMSVLPAASTHRLR